MATVRAVKVQGDKVLLMEGDDVLHAVDFRHVTAMAHALREHMINRVPPVVPVPPPLPAPESIELLSLREIERRHVLRIVQAVNGNKTRAAEVLEIDRRTLYRMLKKFGTQKGKP